MFKTFQNWVWGDDVEETVVKKDVDEMFEGFVLVEEVKPTPESPISDDEMFDLVNNPDFF